MMVLLPLALLALVFASRTQAQPRPGPQWQRGDRMIVNPPKSGVWPDGSRATKAIYGSYIIPDPRKPGNHYVRVKSGRYTQELSFPASLLHGPIRTLSK